MTPKMLMAKKCFDFTCFIELNSWATPWDVWTFLYSKAWNTETRHWNPESKTVLDSVTRRQRFHDDWFNETHHLDLSKLDLVDLLRTATKDQPFLFNGQLFKQTDGVDHDMGSPLGPSNVFMCGIEENLQR